VSVEPILATYADGLSRAIEETRLGERLLVLFLGGTIGNFDRQEAVRFLGDIRSKLRPGDGFLVGTDLLKPVPTLIAAYDDSLGVTAAFNKNLLVRLNRELGAAFDLARFDHQARWNEAERRIEMHLVARSTHAVPLGTLGLDVEFAKGRRSGPRAPTATRRTSSRRWRRARDSIASRSGWTRSGRSRRRSSRRADGARRTRPRDSQPPDRLAQEIDRRVS
jgi:hypothetical protein